MRSTKITYKTESLCQIFVLEDLVFTAFNFLKIFIYLMELLCKFQQALCFCKSRQSGFNINGKVKGHKKPKQFWRTKFEDLHCYINKRSVVLALQTIKPWEQNRKSRNSLTLDLGQIWHSALEKGWVFQ